LNFFFAIGEICDSLLEHLFHVQANNVRTGQIEISSMIEIWRFGLKICDSTQTTLAIIYWLMLEVIIKFESMI
jgi:hypothetical protein